MKTGPYCFKHDPRPEWRAANVAAEIKGGLMNRPTFLPDAVDPRLNSPQAIIRCISESLGAATRGQLDTNIANSRIYGCSVALKAVELATIGRLDALEKALRLRKAGNW